MAIKQEPNPEMIGYGVYSATAENGQEDQMAEEGEYGDY